VFDLEEIFPGVLGCHQKMFPGYGSEQGFCTLKDWNPSGDDRILALAVLDYIHQEASDDELTILGLYKDLEGVI
jgi:hypothetical protein